MMEFQHAIELEPELCHRPSLVRTQFAVVIRTVDNAIAEVKRALELDPLSLIINADLGRTYISSRRYDEAIEQLHKTLEMDPNFYFAHRHLGSVLMAKGDFKAAIAEYQKARMLNNDPRVLGLLAYASARSGDRPEALYLIK